MRVAAISNNVGSVKLFLERTSALTPKSFWFRPISLAQCRSPRLACNRSVGFSVRPIHLFDLKLQTMIMNSNSLLRGSGMPIQVGVLLNVMSGTELSRVRTEFDPL